MKFGMFILGDNRRPNDSFHTRYEQFLRQIDLAEELGFDSVWFAEHHFTEYGAVPNILTMAAVAATRTERLRIGTGVVIAPFMHPLRLAEEAAMVDVLSNGRLDLGLGRGYQPLEFKKFGLQMEESQGRFDETVKILELAASGEPFSFDGDFWSFEDVCIRPVSVQQPIPLWIAAASPSTFERLGKEGRRILTSPNFTPAELVLSLNKTYMEAYKSSGSGDEPAIPMLKQVYVDVNDKDSTEVPKEHSVSFFRLLGTLIADSEEHATYENYARTKRSLEKVSYETLLRDGVVFGTPDAVVNQVVEHWTTLGVSEFLAWFDFGGLPIEKAEASIRLFAQEVMPAVREQTSAVPRWQG